VFKGIFAAPKVTLKIRHTTRIINPRIKRTTGKIGDKRSLMPLAYRKNPLANDESGLFIVKASESL